MYVHTDEFLCRRFRMLHEKRKQVQIPLEQGLCHIIVNQITEGCNAACGEIRRTETKKMPGFPREVVDRDRGQAYPITPEVLQGRRRFRDRWRRSLFARFF